MFHFRRVTRSALALPVALWLSMFALSPVHARSIGAIERKEDNLAAAGFLIRPANTPERIDMLKRLPANRFVQRVDGDDVTYVYTDPRACACLYVGSQQAYGQYLRAMQAKQLADQQALTAMDYSDQAWNWGAWGAWGPTWGFGLRGW